MSPPITVIVSRGRSKHPAKRNLEEALVRALEAERGVDVLDTPPLYDLAADGPAAAALRSLTGDLIVLSWLHDRAVFWTLHRGGIRGRRGRTSLRPLWAPGPDADRPGDAGVSTTAAASSGDSRNPLARRTIYCLDLRAGDDPAPFLQEIRRIASGPDAAGDPSSNQNGQPLPSPAAPDPSEGLGRAKRVEEDTRRRWYPVIDFDRCTNCMECIDFCLFGVYGVDRSQSILVEQPDNCRPGCPACSRVCPENAIMFPEHKTPAIAGAHAVPTPLKLDLSELFGGPSEQEIAAREREQHLRTAASPTAPGEKQAEEPARDDSSQANDNKDELDRLLDSLDEFEL